MIEEIEEVGIKEEEDEGKAQKDRKGKQMLRFDNEDNIQLKMGTLNESEQLDESLKQFEVRYDLYFRP